MSSDKDGTETAPIERTTKGRFAPGNRGGPGRPRAGLALAERIRERISPDVVIDLAIQVAEDTSLPADKRLAALLPFVQLGYLRPPTASAIRVETKSSPSVNWSALPPEVKRELLESIRRARAALPDATDSSQTPSDSE